MPTGPGTYLALLRGINVGGHNRIPMAELRSLCTEIGWDDVQSYIQSGNLLFASANSPARLENQLEEAIEQRFDLQIPVIVRSSKDWHEYAGTNPFPNASAETPNLVALALSKCTPNPDAAERLQERAADGERVALAGNALWIHFAAGTARSKLSPAVLDRLVGSTVTARNWRTVCKLRDMLG